MWRIEVKERIVQDTVYLIESDSKEQAEEIVRQTENSAMEQLAFYIEDRIVVCVLSIEPYGGQR
jgi:hypothetical protein